MRKYALLTALVVIIIFTGSQGVHAVPNASFPDVESDYWAAKQILSLANYGIISGNSDGTFEPTGSLNRGGLAKLLALSFTLKPSSEPLTFKDMDASHWAAGHVSKVVAQGWVKGFPDNTFRPNDLATRAQVAKILVQAKGYSLPETSKATFSDVSENHWAYPYIEAAVSNYLIGGYPDGTFKPDAQISRAEAAALIYRALMGKDYLINSSAISQVTYERYRRFLEAGPLNINVLKIPKSAPLSMDLGLAKGRVTGLEKLSSMAQTRGALAGINADYFSADGKSGCSGIMVDGQIISSPIASRSFLGMLPDKTCFIDKATMVATVTSADNSGYPIQWINKARDSFSNSNMVMLYTPFYGPSTLTTDTGTEVVAKLNGIVAPNSEVTCEVVDVRYNAGNSTIPLDCIVLSGVGSGKSFLTDTMKIGDTIKLNFNFGTSWRDGASTVGGGPRLVRNSIASVESEGFSSSIVNGRHPRTGIGIDLQGNLIVTVVDGRMNYFSIGMTLAELAADLKNRGAADAMNLDGGGSSTLYFNGSVRNYPNAGSGERAICNAILFMQN